MGGNRHRYEYHDRQPSRRSDSKRTVPGTIATVIVCLAIVGLLGAFAWAALTDGDLSSRAPKRTDEATTPTPTVQLMATVGGVNVYVLTDPDTNVQYLIPDKGGIYERVRPERDITEEVADVG